MLALGQAMLLGATQGLVLAARQAGHARAHALVEENGQGQAHAHHDALVQIAGPKARVQAKEMMEMAPSYHWAFQAWTKPEALISPMTAIMIDRGQHGLGQMVEQGREEEQHDDHHGAR